LLRYVIGRQRSERDKDFSQFLETTGKSTKAAELILGDA